MQKRPQAHRPRLYRSRAVKNQKDSWKDGKRRGIFLCISISYNARYTKYRGVKKPSFRVSASIRPAVAVFGPARAFCVVFAMCAVLFLFARNGLLFLHIHSVRRFSVCIALRFLFLFSVVGFALPQCVFLFAHCIRRIFYAMQSPQQKTHRFGCLRTRKHWFWPKSLPHNTPERAWKYTQYSTRPFQGTLGTNLRARTATHPPPGDFGLVQGKAAQAALLAGKLL